MSNEFETSKYYDNVFERDSDAVFIKVHSEEQELESSCGPAVITDVLKTLGKNVTQLEIIEDVDNELKKMQKKKVPDTVEELGTPPSVMLEILSTHNVEFEVKPSDETVTKESTARSELFLDTKLKEGKVVITPIQTIPNYKEKRNLDNDGHYIIVCGSVELKGAKYYITVDPLFHYYQRLSNENSLYGVHYADEKPNAIKKVEPETEYDTVETRDAEYTQEQLDSFSIDPKRVRHQTC